MSRDRAEWVAVALLGKTRGNRGEITALALSDKPERYAELTEVWLFRGGSGSGEKTEVESTWFHNGSLVFKFRGVDSISQAEELSGAEVRVPWDLRVPAEPGEYYQSELVGCEVIDRRSGERLGRVTAWQDAGGSGMLEVDSSWLLPFVRAICVEIDPAAGRILVELPDGLMELNRT